MVSISFFTGNLSPFRSISLYWMSFISYGLNWSRCSLLVWLISIFFCFLGLYEPTDRQPLVQTDVTLIWKMGYPSSVCIRKPTHSSFNNSSRLYTKSSVVYPSTLCPPPISICCYMSKYCIPVFVKIRTLWWSSAMRTWCGAWQDISKFLLSNFTSLSSDLTVFCRVLSLYISEAHK